MNRLIARTAAAAFVIVTSTAPLQAQMSNDDDFIQCMIDCQDWQPDQAIVRQCENWCYAYYNPN
ncbi:hypothetical protein K3181_03935 [Qipengyuania sp. YG27]|uniref:Uncharacterized protein n=1 Tax=Qipengyuania mesophila TaxID=2867246 RepID=A0ABS7JSF6_9SPHN|nr:hypothetical protein [Qipengyuania mesophila]MBX7500585.1 hypothetical protein [Qipengyuania mesophila]